MPVVGSYFFASVVGFRSAAGFRVPVLRVRVERVDAAAGCVWVRTADLRDAGTPLVLAPSKLIEEAR